MTVKTEGPVLLQGFGSADPSSEGGYQDQSCDTFDGSVMAVFRGAGEAGEAKITFSAAGCPDEKLLLQIR